MGLPYAFCRDHGVMQDPDAPERLLMTAPIDISAFAEARRVLDGPLQLQIVTDIEFAQRFERWAQAAPADDAQQIIADMGDEADLRELIAQVPRGQDLLESVDQAPVIRLVNALLTRAVREGASDIHIEPYETRLAVRFRIDGMLREVLEPPVALAPVLAARIKVMSRLDIAERRLPQDGRISLGVAGRAVDVRVSTIPSGHGERVVLRLLDKQAGRIELEDVGLRGKQLERMLRLIAAPHGVLLVTGPTGSGKTTSLYACLSRLNDQSRNIMTVEDPIEYFLDGVGQTQVNNRVDMSFARGLRAILRQDPDVVMVGEIRDLETAQVAVQASLTGHLVLSTLHTNTALGAVTRLKDMGVEPFLLASSLVGVLAQRLVRRLCDACKDSYEPNISEVEGLGISVPTEAFRASGCESCQNSGYRGRVGIFELIPADETVRRLVHDGASESELEAHVRQSSPSLVDDGLSLVREGITSISELRRACAQL